MAEDTKKSDEQDDALRKLQREYARRKGRVSSKPAGEPVLHAGGFSKTAQCQKCSSYKTKTLFTDRGQSIREHICNLCGWRFKTEMLDIEPPRKRFRRGLRRTPRASRMMLTHDGRTMSVSEWASETGLSPYLIRSRIRSGLRVQEALTNPAKQHIKLTHNGVTADVNTWAINIGVPSKTILARLRHGWTVERTLTTPRTRAQSRASALQKPSRQVATLTFDNRTQTISQWSREIGVGSETIRKRMRLGWTDQQIIETPFHKSKRQRALRAKPERPVKKRSTLTHDNRSMSISEWAAETGISVAVIYGRLRLGWSIEDALSSSRLRTLTCNGVTASIREWSAKTGLSVGAIRARLRRGWTDQEVIETPFRKNPRQPVKRVKPARQRRMLTHDGRTMSVADWAAETGISVAVIDGRLRLRWNIKTTLETPVKTPHLILHDGRVQSAADWSRETGVKLQLILHRLKRDWTLQEIISTPAGAQRVRGHENEQE